MVVHIGGGIRASDEELKYFRAIIDEIHRKGGSIARNWTEMSNRNLMLKNQKNDKVDWYAVSRDNEAALGRSDLYIAEVSEYRLYPGYELANALHQGKPVLLVANKSFREFAISGVKNPLLTMKTYNSEDELRQIVNDFLQKHMVSATDKEVQVPVSPKVMRYLKDQSHSTGKGRVDLLQELIERGLEKQGTCR